MGTMLSGVTSMAARQVLAALSKTYAEATGIPVHFSSRGGVEAARQVREGLAVDLIALASGPIDALAGEGYVVPGSRVDYARSGVAIAIPVHAPRPPVATAQDVRRAMLKARRVAYSTGPSGDHLRTLWAKWGIGGEMAERALLAPAGTPVATLLAKGEADLGFQQASELMGQPGIEVLGPLPDPIQLVTVFSCAISATTSEQGAAADFLKFLISEQAHQEIRGAGMELA